jgi:hypothetical protein
MALKMNELENEDGGDTRAAIAKFEIWSVSPLWRFRFLSASQEGDRG